MTIRHLKRFRGEKDSLPKTARLTLAAKRLLPLQPTTGAVPRNNAVLFLLHSHSITMVDADSARLSTTFREGRPTEYASKAFYKTTGQAQLERENEAEIRGLCL